MQWLKGRTAHHLPGSSKQVSHGRLRNDREIKSGIGCQFPARIAYRDTQQVDGVLILGAAPDFVNELIVSPHPSGVTDQNVQFALHAFEGYAVRPPEPWPPPVPRKPVA
jgi:hypothetical protein